MSKVVIFWPNMPNFFDDLFLETPKFFDDLFLGTPKFFFAYQYFFPICLIIILLPIILFTFLGLNNYFLDFIDLKNFFRLFRPKNFIKSTQNLEETPF